MEFKKFINELVKKISDYQSLVSEFNDIEEKNILSNEFNEKYESLKNKIEDLSELKASFFFDVDDIYKLSIENNYFYFDCPQKVYVNHFEKRFIEFKEYALDADLLDFIKHEISVFNAPNNHRVIKELTNSKSTITVSYSDYFSSNNHRYSIALNKKVDFLSTKAKEFGFSIDYQEGEEYYNEYTGHYLCEDSILTLTPMEKEKLVVLEPNKQNQLTTNQIVLLLQETGFFTHPKIEDASKVKQAELISLITGLHQKNIKTNIQKLDKLVSENGANYKRDIDKINKIIDDLA
jgi:hypothetical protein